MNTLTSSNSTHYDLRSLTTAIAQASGEDALSANMLTPAQWDLLAPYLQPVVLAASQILFAKGVSDRTLFLIESGTLSVHYEDDKGRLRMALVGSGSLVGEGGFFVHRPRSATVQAAAPCKLWGLAALRFTELSNRQPAVALALSMAAGSVMSRRLGNRKRRIAVT